MHVEGQGKGSTKARLTDSIALVPGVNGAVSQGIGQGARAGVRAGSAEARGLGIRAVQMGEAIKFGCKSIKGEDDPGNGDDLSSGGDISDDDSFGAFSRKNISLRAEPP